MAVNYADYTSKYPQLNQTEIKEAAEHFNSLSHNTGKVNDKDIVALFKELNQNLTIEQARTMIGQFDQDHDGTLSFNEFLQIYIQEKEGKKSSFAEGLQKHKNLIKVGGAGGANRSYAQEEVAGFVNFLNSALAGDEDLKDILPINPDTDQIFRSLSNGLLLCKMVNLAQPDTIDERVIAKGKKLNSFSAMENITLALNSAKSIGISTVNVGNIDIRDGTVHLCLGLTWQIIRLALVKDIQLSHVPELFRLLEEGEELKDLLKLSPEQILLRWLNYHLKNAGSQRKATNFGNDLSDSEILTTVLKQIAPECCTLKPMNESDLTQRAELMLQESEKIDCRKFVTPAQVVKGNARLNLAFVANLFNTRHGLEALSEAELAALDEALFAAGGDRLERQYALWMNSYGVEPFVVSLLDSLQDGLVLLQMFDKIQPGIVNWKTVHKTKLNKFKCVENLNQSVEIGKKLGFSLVNICGADIYDQNKMLTLALLWQMMRFDYLKIFTKLGGGARIKDEQIVNWANEKTAPRDVKIDSFKDDRISDSKPLLTLIDVLKPETVDWSIYDPNEPLRNAKYVLSMVRKFGYSIYALPEDLVEHIPQMVMTVYASLMAMAV